MSEDLGFAAPVSRRDLTTLRNALAAIRTGAAATAIFRTPEHGRFSVSGPVRKDLTDTTFKVGWWDLTTGKVTDPVTDLQSLTTASSDDTALPDPEAAEEGELRGLIETLEANDVVTADFEFEGCGAFSISGGIRRDESGTTWVLAGHYLSLDGVPASRVRRIHVLHRAMVPAATRGSYDLFGA